MKSKHFVFLLFVLILRHGISQGISVFDCALDDPFVTQSEVQQSGSNFFQPCILLGNNQPFEFAQPGSHLIEAHEYIRLTFGVHLGKFADAGQMHLRLIPKNGFDVAMMNYPALDQIQRYERFELGIQLNSELLTKIDNFVNEVQTSEKINPYLEWEMKVFAEFTAPGSTQAIVIDGFYNKEFASWENYSILQGQDYINDAQYASLGGYTELADPYPFRIRFAPPKNGNWDCKVKVMVQNELVYESPTFSFNVVESGNPGYVKVGDNKRYLKRNGTFFPLGCNLPWPETTPASDPELAAYMEYIDGGGTQHVFTENFMSKHCIPRTYDKYRNTMQQLANGGANYYRSIMYPSATEIEFENLGNYTNRLHMAQEMDEILEHAENLGLFIHWNMQIHYSFQASANAYGSSWVWSGGNGIENCYKSLVGEDPVNFLTSDTAKTYYKQRLRYILARWGYSTNVAIWELFSEINNVGSAAADNSDFYMQGNNWQIYRDWHWEMAEYLKSMYHGQVHLVTGNYTGTKHALDNSFDSPHMDVMTSNIYDWGEPDFGEFYIDKVARNMLNDNNSSSYTYNFTKPLIFSETDPIEALCDHSKIELRRSIWQVTFSGLAGALSWEMRKSPVHFGIYGQVRTFLGDLDMDGEDWHPGSVDVQKILDVDYSSFPPQINGVIATKWIYNDNYAKYMDGFVDPPNGSKRIKKADFINLMNQEKNLSIGVITNKTINVRTIGNGCYTGPWQLSQSSTGSYYPISFMEGVDCRDEDLHVSSLIYSPTNKKYFFQFFSVNSEQLGDEVSGKIKNEKLQLKYKFWDGNDEYFVPTKIRKNNTQFLNQPEIENLRISQNEIKINVTTIENQCNELRVSPNPTSQNFNIDYCDQVIDKIEIYNTLGNKIPICYEYHDIDIKHLSNGIYFIVVYSQGNIITHKLIKQ